MVFPKVVGRLKDGAFSKLLPDMEDGSKDKDEDGDTAIALLLD